MVARPERWGIVGGGLLGMTLAFRLARAGRSVTIFEGAEQLGGLATPWKLGEVTWDRHYHVILLSDTTLRSLLAELGLESELKWRETRVGFYTDGRLHSMSNALEFLKFPPLGMVDKARLGANIFYASKVKDWKRLEKITATEWLKRWSGTATFEKIWLPLLRAKLGDNYSKASAAFIWAIIARLYSARRTGLKKEMFGYVQGGYAHILERYGEVLESEGVETRLRHVVRNVESAPDGTGICVRCENGHEETYDRVVLTMASPIATAVCPEIPEEDRKRHLDIQYQGIVCASLLLRKPLGGFYVTNITDTWVPFTGVIEMTTLVDPGYFGGKTLIYLPKYVPSGDPYLLTSDQEVEGTFIEALLRMYPSLKRDDILEFRVSRIPFVQAISTLEYSDRMPSMTVKNPGLHIINSAHILNGTLNVNETVQLANRESERLIGGGL